MLYFAYGSNLDWNQMLKRCPSAEFVCVAKLEDHQLAFTRRSVTRGCGVADALPHPGNHVWGVVYQIEGSDIGRLDACEGFKPERPKKESSYVREERKVYKDGVKAKPMLVSVYLANQEANPPHPNAEYKSLIVRGAKHWHLPEEYIAELERIQVHV
jgi:hypothetical protein